MNVFSNFASVKVYFYHTQDIQMILEKLCRGEFPPHYLYGATKLEERHGIGVVWHKSRVGLPRWRMMLRNAWQILTCREHFDAIYATHYRGLEVIVMLRALGLYRKPIVVWHHQPIITPKSKWREWLGRLFYRGFDHMFFFSQKLINDSLKSQKARPERLHLGHWGMDPLPSAEVFGKTNASGPVFISTGKEMRDMPTLIKAFNVTGCRLEIYINRNSGGVNYEEVFGGLEMKPNIHLHFCSGLAPHEISLLVKDADCVVICCHETKYTVGLTTVVEALALGKPVICSRNPQIPVDFEAEGCGISVPYYDVEGWVRAVNYMKDHPQEALAMGRKGLQLARTTYNDARCADDVAAVLKTLPSD